MVTTVTIVARPGDCRKRCLLGRNTKADARLACARCGNTRYHLTMELEKFFPYRLAVLAEQVSLATAQVYRTRFALGRDEWRVLAALAQQGEVRAADVKERTTLEKMQVSRALARLESDGLIARLPDPADGRAWRVRVLPAGMALYRKVV